MLATPSGVSRAASSAFSCRCAIPGHRTSRSDYTRGQSPETGSLSRHLAVWEPCQACLIGSCLAGSGFTSLVYLEDDAGLRTVASIGDSGWGSPGAHGPGLMRSGPAGEERRTPRYTVPVSPQCPQEIGLPTLPRKVFQGAAISSEHTSQFLPEKRSGAEMLATPSGVSRAASLAFSCRCAVPGHRTSRSDYTRGQSPETGSLSRLFGSVETTAKCVSVGHAHSREKLQNPVRFSSASIQRGESHSGGPRAGSGNGTRGRYSLKEGGHRDGSSSWKRVRVLGGLRPILDLHQFEPLSQQTEVKDAQTGRVSDQVRGLVCHDRSKRRILPYLYLSHSQGVPEVCFWGQSLPISGSSLQPSTLTSHFYKVCECRVSSIAATGHPHTQLHRRLVDSRSIRADGGSTSRCCSRSHESVGVKTERQEECAFSSSENHLSGCGLGFDHDAGTYVTCSDRVDPHCSRESERRPVTHCQAGSETAGSDGSCVQCDTSWSAVHETPTGVAQDQGFFFLRGNPLRMIKVTRRCLCALDMWRQPWFLSQGPVLGAPCRRVMPATDASLTGWGADILSRQGPRPGEWMLHPKVVKQIWRVFGQAQVDLFATQETAQCPLWYSLIHPAPLGLDAVVQTWPRLRLYIFPLIALLPGVLARVRRDEVSLLLVAPFWPGRVWFSDLISLLNGSPWGIPVRRDLLSQAGVYHPHPEMWKFWVWPLWGRNS